MDNRAACPDDSLLADYLAGSLDDADRMSVERHTARCEGCRTRLVNGFEYNRERALASPTPEDVVARGLSVVPQPRANTPLERPEKARSAPPPGGLKWAIILLLLAALVALAMVFLPEIRALF